MIVVVLLLLQDASNNARDAWHRFQATGDEKAQQKLLQVDRKFLLDMGVAGCLEAAD